MYCHIIFSSLLFISLRFGCLGAPISDNLYQHPDFQEVINTIKDAEVGILADACILVENNTISKEFSIKARRLMLENATNFLQDRGFRKILKIHNHAIAGFIDDEYATVALAGRNSDQRLISLPISVEKSYEDEITFDDLDPKCITALTKCTWQIHAQEARSYDGGIPCERSSAWRNRCVDEVRHRTTLRYVLILCGVGNHVGRLKSISQNFVVAAAATAFTPLVVLGQGLDKSHLDSYAGLLDLKENKILWLNSLRFESIHPAAEKFYNEIWSRELLFYCDDINSLIIAQLRSGGLERWRVLNTILDEEILWHNQIIINELQQLINDALISGIPEGDDLEADNIALCCRALGLSRVSSSIPILESVDNSSLPKNIKRWSRKSLKKMTK